MNKSISFFCTIILLVVITRCGNSGMLNHSANGLDSLSVEKPTGTFFYDAEHNKWHTDIGGVILNNSKAYDYKDFEVEVSYLNSAGKIAYTKNIKLNVTAAVPNSRCFVMENIATDSSINFSKDSVYKLNWKLLKATPVLRTTN